MESNFTSYLDKEIFNGKNDPHTRDSNSKPKLLSNELEVARAGHVYLFSNPIAKIKYDDGIVGLLIVTNFRVSFIPNDRSKLDSLTHQENIFLGRYDVTLSNIDVIYQILDRKRRQIGPHLKISTKLEALEIICKNFRVFKFGFRKSEIGKGKHIAEALTKFAFPTRHNLLFSYNFKENYYNILRNICMFNERNHWQQELKRCGATGWRVLSLDAPNSCPGMPTGTLPLHICIPKSVSETDYLKLANSFRDSRTAIWVFSIGNASLVRMAELIPTITDSKQENKMLELIRKCEMNPPYLLELSKHLPTIQDVYLSYTKFRDICVPNSSRKFMLQDQRFYSLLDKSCWLLYVSLCLKQANETAGKLRTGQTVVLQENDGRDMCCIISSITQILLDPFYRTLNGFQTLIQKEWVAMGHPFSDRLGHVINSETTEQSPLFLLFLDCTWQLLIQFPEEFEFSETFLTSIWDSTFMPIFDTFQFNSEHDRHKARVEEHLTLRPVWDWGEQFTDKDILLFTNPMYKRPPQPDVRRSLAILPPNAIPLPGLLQTGSRHTINVSSMTPLPTTPPPRYLTARHQIIDLELWAQCYYRWLPILEIRNGGYPQIELLHRMLLTRILKLQQALQSRDFDELPSGGDESNLKPKHIPSVSSFFPFSGSSKNTNELNDILTLSNDLLMDGSIFDGLSLSQDAV